MKGSFARSGEIFPFFGRSAIDFLAVPHTKNQNDQAVILDLADEPVITHAVLPELT
jgi:hypothetical protein